MRYSLSAGGWILGHSGDWVLLYIVAATVDVLRILRICFEAVVLLSVAP